MKRIGLCWILTALLAMLVVLPMQATARTLDTRVTMVIGFPGNGEESSSVTVVPGTVMPVSMSHGRQVNVDEESEDQARELQELADKLRRGVGLEAVEVAYSEVYSLARGAAKDLTGPRSTSAIHGELTLLDFNSDLAVFRVGFKQHQKVLPKKSTIFWLICAHKLGTTSPGTNEKQSCAE